MIQDLTQTITELPGFPQRASYTDTDAYGVAVETWLGQQKDNYPELNAMLSELDTFITETNSAVTETDDNLIATNADVVSTNADVVLASRWAEEDEDIEVVSGQYSALHHATKAAASVGTLPASTIDDSVISSTKAWSSEKIYDELDQIVRGDLFHLQCLNSFNLKNGVGYIENSRDTTGTMVDRYGVLKTKAAHEPRFEKRGVIGSCGFTQECLYSNDVSSVLWVKNGDVAESQDGTLTSDGTSQMWKLTSADFLTAGNHVRTPTITITDTGQDVTFSAEVKEGDDPLIQFRLIVTGGTTIDASSVFNYSTATWETKHAGHKNFYVSEQLSNGAYRVSLTMAMNNSGNTWVRNYISGNTYLGTSIYIANTNIVEKSFITPYVATTSTSVTVAGDVISYDTENNIPDLTADWSMKWVGTIYFDSNQTDQRLIMNYVDVLNSFRVFIHLGKMNMLIVKGGSVVYSAGPTIVSGQEFSLEFKCLSGIVSMYIDNVLQDSDDFSGVLGVSLADTTYIANINGTPNTNLLVYTKLHTWRQL